jgi:hypothetical protein
LSLRQVESKERCCSSGAGLEISGPPSSLKAANTTLRPIRWWNASSRFCDICWLRTCRRRPCVSSWVYKPRDLLPGHRDNLWLLGGEIISDLHESPRPCWPLFQIRAARRQWCIPRPAPNRYHRRRRGACFMILLHPADLPSQSMSALSGLRLPEGTVLPGQPQHRDRRAAPPWLEARVIGLSSRWMRTPRDEASAAANVRCRTGSC